MSKSSVKSLRKIAFWLHGKETQACITETGVAVNLDSLITAVNECELKAWYKDKCNWDNNLGPSSSFEATRDNANEIYVRHADFEAWAESHVEFVARSLEELLDLPDKALTRFFKKLDDDSSSVWDKSALSNGEFDEFIRSLRVYYENDSEIRIQEPRKKAVTYNCEALGFRDNTTKEWKTFIGIIQSPERTYCLGVASARSPDKKKMPNNSYYAKRKRLEAINDKLVSFFKMNLSLKIPDGYKLYELCPDQKKGTYRFKFQIRSKDEKAELNEAERDWFFTKIRERFRDNAPPNTIKSAVGDALHAGITQEELREEFEDILPDVLPETSIYDPYENKDSDSEH